MKKLNTKGFAVSTMLYGILTLVILILYLLLGTMRSSYNKENEVTDNLLYYMNKCINKQLELETCYMTYDDEPTNLRSCTDEYNAYITCVGVKNNNVVSGNNVYLKEAIISRTDELNSGLIVDDLASTAESKRYIYIGDNPANYIKIGNQTGRIISREVDGTIKVILDEAYETKFDTGSSNAQSGTELWKNSVLYGLLEKKLKQMDYNDIYLKGVFYTGIVYESNSVNDALTNIRLEKYETNIGTITLEDYFKASKNIKADSSKQCNLEEKTPNSLGNELNTNSNCNDGNWIAKPNECLWTMTGVGSNKIISINNSKMLNTDPTATCNGKLVVYLSANTKVYASGNGTSNNQFVVDLRN